MFVVYALHSNRKPVELSYTKYICNYGFHFQIFGWDLGSYMHREHCRLFNFNLIIDRIELALFPLAICFYMFHVCFPPSASLLLLSFKAINIILVHCSNYSVNFLLYIWVIFLVYFLSFKDCNMHLTYYSVFKLILVTGNICTAWI